MERVEECCGYGRQYEYINKKEIHGTVRISYMGGDMRRQGIRKDTKKYIIRKKRAKITGRCYTEHTNITEILQKGRKYCKKIRSLV